MARSMLPSVTRSPSLSTTAPHFALTKTLSQFGTAKKEAFVEKYIYNIKGVTEI